jgi:monoamine oxidase
MSHTRLTDMLRRIHDAVSQSKITGQSPKEILEQDRLRRVKLNQIHRTRKERRHFIKGVGIGMAAAAMPTIAAPALNNGVKTGQNQPKIAVIGSGAGGMRTAHRLMQYGMTCTVYEGNTRIGGRMYSDSSYFSDGRTVEWGGELISTEHTVLRNLVHQLGLELTDVGKNTAGEEEVYLIGGQLYNEHNLMDEWVSGIYELMKRTQQRAPWQPLYNAHTADHYELDHITAQDWLTQNGIGPGSWVHQLLMTDLVAEYGVTDNNSALNLIYLLGWTTRNSGGLPLAGTDERFRVKTGNGSVISKMAEQLGHDRIQTGKKLIAIHGEYAGPYQLTFEDGSIDSCEKLVIAMPYHLIKELDIDPRIWNGFSAAKQRSILEMQAADNGKLQLEFSSRSYARSRQINGRDIMMSAVTYSDPDSYISTWEGDVLSPSEKGIIVNYTGGIQGRQLGGEQHFGEASPQDVGRLLQEYDKIWPGISGEFTGKAIVSNWWQNPWSRGAFVSPVIGSMTGFWGAQWEIEGNIHFAGEATDPETWSYMNGAIASGERVAREIAQG